MHLVEERVVIVDRSAQDSGGEAIILCEEEVVQVTSESNARENLVVNAL